MKLNPSVPADVKTAYGRFDHYVTEHVGDNPTLRKLVGDIEADFSAGVMFGIADVSPTPETGIALRLLADALDYAWSPDSVQSAGIKG